MSKAKQSPDAVLLSYNESTVPSPLQVSSGSAETGQIILSVPSDTGVLCQQITVSIPVGDSKAEVYSAAPTGSIDSTEWSISSETVPGKKIGLDPGLKYTVITLDNNTSGYEVTTSFVLTISGNVNTHVGDAVVVVKEYSSPVVRPDYSEKTKDFIIRKAAPRPFYVSNFISSVPGTPTIPVTEFFYGHVFSLSWESNGTYFKVYKKNDSRPVYEGTATSCQAIGGIHKDTTFVLVATRKEETLYATLTVTVTNPALTPRSVATHENDTVKGDLTVTGITSLTNSTLSGTLTVSGNTSLANFTTSGTASITGNTSLSNASASGTLNVAGNSTFNATQVNGTLSVSGAATLGNTSVNGSFSALTGKMTIIGKTKLLASGYNIPMTAITVLTDGFLIAQVTNPGDSGKSSFCYGTVNVGPLTYSVLGGTVGSFGSDWAAVMNNNPNCITIPLPANSFFTIQGFTGSGSQWSSIINFYWIPIGAAPSGADTFEIKPLTADEISTQRPAPQEIFRSITEKQQARAENFVTKLEKAFGQSIEAEKKKELAALLLEL